MGRDDVIRMIGAHQAEIRQFGVRSLALFGSVARDDARPDSDVDLLVEFYGPTTSDGYMGLKFFLEDLLNRRVDLVTQRALRPALRSYVERDLVRVA